MQLPYLIIGGAVILWALLVAVTKFPMAATNHNDDASKDKSQSSFFGLFKRWLYIQNCAA